MKLAVVCPYYLTPHVQRSLGICVKDYTRATGTINLSHGLSKVRGVEVHQVSLSRYIKGRVVIRDGDLEVHFLGIPPKVTSMSFLQYPKLLVHKELDRIRPDIVHGHHAETGDAYYAVSSKYRSVAGIHNYLPILKEFNKDTRFSTMSIFRHFEQYAIKHAAHITVDSRYIERIISPMTNAKIHRIPNCIHYDFFDNAKSEYGSMREGVKIITYFGQIRKEKGLDVLLAGLPLIQKEVPRVILKIIGNVTDSSRSDIQRKAADLGVARNINILGWMEWSQIISELKKTDIVVIPSLFEPFGCTAIEAMAMGMPVLGSRTGGIEENIREDETGLLFNVGDSQDLATKAIRLLRDGEMRMRLGKNAADYAKMTYHPSVVAEQHVELYRSLLAKQG